MTMFHLSIKDAGRAMYCIRCGYELDHVAQKHCPQCELPFDPDNTSSFIQAFTMGSSQSLGTSALSSGVLSWIMMAAVLLTASSGTIQYVHGGVVAATLAMAMASSVHAMILGRRAHFGHPFGSATGFAGLLLGATGLLLLGGIACLF